MAGGREFSKYQQKVISRFYEHRDTLSAQKLGEIVSDLYLCETEKKREQLWKRAEQALVAVKADPKRVAAILEKRSVEGLAKIVGELSGKP